MEYGPTGEIEAIYAPDGRLVFEELDGNNLVFREEYWHQDHLGNTRVAICDFNNNGRVEITDDPNTAANELEITKEQHLGVAIAIHSAKCPLDI